jgi:DNA-binding transcriptional regulator YiaG
VADEEGQVRGPDLREARRLLSLTQIRLAELLDVDSRSVSRWEVSDRPVPRHVELIISILLSVPAARRHIGLEEDL